ncbi:MULTISPECIES: sigma 54-interacting transcriptional regulator [unclassified Gilliamella]|uniref:sigma 54-interacting transcriptional regulator n=1 Tax=unclassified Gilliamella TaxID=2685620 RepID=UPI00226AD715|nr:MULTISPECIES: sigma 54-interacting transcriptional regulator [unclassified Gilliamella]MCX8573605.1 sigma 54-interacting transcriptional regulator [Gilliamella sp. B3831]MCX8575767.1 sigma 54-interacting transcriptional regulator [Gilliamella sp. B3815]MCX8579819.1 sigma 54-interacting transcriptional regulator [Gilliamella sp. B2717]MCX8589968.1 sigma 54-interacting transcriptional regulator [Gilliamella sp. B3812]MCX8602869.1 sigma 54-interacting transcriptional regulator [Gilliamella sp.
MQIAILEIDHNKRLIAYNDKAKALLSSTLLTLQQPFDYQAIFHLDKTQGVDELDDTIIVLNAQYYLLQKVNETSKTIFIIQPIEYLKKRLSKIHVVASQAFDIFATQSNAMQKLIAQAKAFSMQREPLLISGETGTGKDLLAYACHQYSPRGEQTFLALNCAAMPDEVVESELYGHAAGAYPGVIESKKGFFEQANGGSVLLDGIDEMSFQMQTKLLRFINDGYFRRVGDDNEVYVDVRIICATKVDLADLVEQGKFRKDLYYRLNVLSLHLPSLRERKEDIAPLTMMFVNEFADKQGIPAPYVDNEVFDYLARYSWPGNVRQLKNILYCALSQLTSTKLTVNDIELPVQTSSRISSIDNIENKTLDEMTKQFEKEILLQLYDKYPSSRKLAKRLGVSHTAIANKLRDYGMNR